MPTIANIRNKFSDHLGIQCVCDAFPYPGSSIVMRSRVPTNVLKALMWNRGVHMVLAGYPEPNIYGDDINRAWKNVIQIAIDCEVFDKDNMVIVKDVEQTPNGLLVWFEPPIKRSQEPTFRKRLLKIKRKFATFDYWGTTPLEPYVP